LVLGDLSTAVRTHIALGDYVAAANIQNDPEFKTKMRRLLELNGITERKL
jgi:hypothetical protein